jgi:hypothetical protein
MLFNVPIGIGLLPCMGTITLSTVRVAPFLVTAFLADEAKAVLT